MVGVCVVGRGRRPAPVGFPAAGGPTAGRGGAPGVPATKLMWIDSQPPAVLTANKGERGPEGLEWERIAAPRALADLAGGDDRGVLVVAPLNLLQLEAVIAEPTLEASQPGGFRKDEAQGADPGEVVGQESVERGDVAVAFGGGPVGQ